MPPQINLNTAASQRAQFIERYWFSSTQLVTVVNPTAEDYHFMSELRNFMVPKGGTEDYVGTIANVYLDQMSKNIAQRDDQLELIADYVYRTQAYDGLIVAVKDLAPQYDSIPDWQKRAQAASDKTPHWMQGQAAKPDPSTPPWEQAVAPVAPPATQPPRKEPAKQPVKPKAETKEFEYNGLKFKAVTDEAGNTTYTKNDMEISGADYLKAASML